VIAESTMRDAEIADATTEALELLGRIADGDAASLALLFDRHHADVLRFIGRMGASRSDADDLVQQTFLQVMTAARSFDGRASLRAWLFGVAAMIVRRHRFSLARIAKRIASFSVAEPRSNEPSAEGAAATRDELRRASAALEKLSAKKREVFVMIVMEEARGEEVAAALGIPLATVWTRLHHARRELREHLQKETKR
jgi:RNA polymerase sigma-70 factor (ECF subfamily)